MIWIVLLLALNGGISWWNAKGCGEMWIEANTFGGSAKLLVWSGAVQSALGFSMMFAVVAALAIGGDVGKTIMALWYVLAIVPMIGTGLIITVASWRRAYLSGRPGDAGVAIYNTIADAHNLSNAASGLDTAFQQIGSFFAGSLDADDIDPRNLIVKILVWLVVLLALVLGAGLTWIIIVHYMGTVSVPKQPANA